MAKELAVVLEHNGVKIVADANDHASLTSIWKAGGSDNAKTPARFLRNAHAAEFIESLAGNLKVQICTLTRTVRGGKASGVWAHWQIGMAYAKWIDPNFHQVVNAGFLRWLQEERNPSLKLERGVKKLLDQGYTEEWVEARFRGVVARKQLTSTMQDHNCHPTGKINPYAEATRSVTLAAIGKTPSEFRSEKGLVKKSQPTRDHMTSRELMRIAFAESEAKAMIQERAADGNTECLEAVRTACRGVKAAIRAMAAQSA